MRVVAERIPECQAVLNIEVEPELVERYQERAYRRIVNSVNIPGFRRGKAPRFIVERMFGKDTLFQEGIELMMPEVLKQALEETNLTAFDRPAWDVLSEDPLTLKVVVPLPPKVELGSYKDIRLDPEPVEVTDQEVADMLERIREQQATWIPVERKSEIGDRVTVDVEGYVKEKPLLESASGETLIARKGDQLLNIRGTEYDIKQQPDSLLPGFTEHLIGLAAGDEKEFTIVLPPNYPEESFAGREAIFRVVCHSVKAMQKPELDDEFAKSIGEFSTLDEAKAAIREGLLSRKKAEAERRFAETLIQMVVDRSSVEMPPSLVEREAEEAFERFVTRLKTSGLSVERFLVMAGKTEDELRERLRAEAKRSITQALVLIELAKAEGIEVSQEEIDAEIKRVVDDLAEDASGKMLSILQQPEHRTKLSHDLLDRKVVERLISIAKGEADTAERGQGESVEQTTALDQA